MVFGKVHDFVASLGFKHQPVFNVVDVFLRRIGIVGGGFWMLKLRRLSQ